MQVRKLFVIILLPVILGAYIIYEKVLNGAEDHFVSEVISPVNIVFSDGSKYIADDIQTFDCSYSKNNILLAEKLNITEDEAFITGCLGKNWAENLLLNRHVKVKSNVLMYYKFGYPTRLKNSAFSVKDNQPTNSYAFNKQLNTIRTGKFVILDLMSEKVYPISKINAQKLKNYIVVRRSNVKNILKKKQNSKSLDFAVYDVAYNPVYNSDKIKIVVSDNTTKILPDRNCSSEICKEIINRINNAQEAIDIAIYGYSSTPALEKAIKHAKARGVKIRLVYDVDVNNNNIYPDTKIITNLIDDNKSDKSSSEVRYSMHNKFYIFDGKSVITGSANLSHTDMSGYNSNAIISIDIPEIAKFYKDEFEQMYSGQFHNDKTSFPDKRFNNINVYFSPQDKAIENGVLPYIKKAEKYIYIPAFVITDNKMTKELINAKNRGVDVRIIADALNASTKHSKHKELRSSGILVKAENYAGKMHAKSIIIDDKYLIIGSMNFSNSGQNRNDENIVILKDAGASIFYRKFFIYQWQRIPDKWLKYTPRAEGPDSVGSCSDGIDNNYDNLTDKDDEACKKIH